MKKVYSLSFFRNASSGYESANAGVARGKFFINFIPTIIRAAKEAFPDYEVWIHHDDRVLEFPAFQDLPPEVKLINMGEARELCAAMLWRMQPLLDEEVGWMVCRDVDSLPMHRDRNMVEEAMESGAELHAILDSESHCGPLMGGMIAMNAPAVRTKCREVLSLLGDIDYNRHGSDQIHLNRILWPAMRKWAFIHQRKKVVNYPDAMMTMEVHPQETDLDKIIRHIGAAFDVEKAKAILP